MSGRLFAVVMILSVIAGGFAFWRLSGPTVAPVPIVAVQPPPPEVWVETHSQEFGFTVSAPVALEQVGSTGGSTYNFRGVAPSGATFEVTGTIPTLHGRLNNPIALDRYLNELQNTLIRTLNGDLVSVRLIEEDGRIYGREIEFTAPVFGIVLESSSRMLLINDRLYRPAVTARPEILSEADRQRFLDSFHAQ